MIKILLLAVLASSIILIYVKYIEAVSVFYPSKKIEFIPSSFHLPFKDIYLRAADKVALHGWIIPAKKQSYTVLFLHGNAGNIGDRLDKIRIFYELGWDTFALDYRGYGRSGGKPSDKGIYQDAEAAYNYLVKEKRVVPEKIIIYGESLGGAVAVDLAAKVTAGALILEGTFSKGRDMARKLYPYLPVFLFSDRFNSLSKIKKVNIPQLFIHSIDDELVPVELAKKLYNAAKEPKYFAEIEGSHNQAFLDSKEKFISSLKYFINKLK